MICLATLFAVLPAAGDVVQTHYVKAPNTDPGDFFGSSVAIDGDTMVVGAPSEWGDATGVGGNPMGNGVQESGAAYVYVRNGAAWDLQAYLKATNTGFQDFFGFAVAISGDRIAISAVGEDSEATGVGGNQAGSGAVDSGAVYVFKRSGTTWAFEAYLKPSNTDAFDFFGASLALSGETLAVGAIGEDSLATGVDGSQGGFDSVTGSGAVYVFELGAQGWVQQAYVKASNTDTGDVFGWSVDVDGDDLIVGAIGEASSSNTIDQGQGVNGSTNTGAAYVFRRNGSTWTQQAYLKPWTAQPGNDRFGTSVSIRGGVAAVGAIGDSSSAAGVDGTPTSYDVGFSGAVYLFRGGGSTWAQGYYVKASVPNGSSVAVADADRFGSSVDLGDGLLLVGAEGEGSASSGIGGSEADDSSPSAGAAYLFVDQGPTWAQEAFVKGSATDSDDSFGRVALSGTTFVVGAFGEDGSGTGTTGDDTDDSAADAGAAFVFEYTPSVPIPDGPLCFGDGSGADCPCALGAAGAGCAGASSPGGVLAGVGTPVLGSVGFQLQASGLGPNRPGLCLKGSNLLNAGLGNPVGNGLLCTAGEQRSQVVVSSASGDAVLSDWKGGLLSVPPVANVGAPTFYQWWYRNPGPGCFAGGFNFTNAWSVTWQ